MRNNLIKESIDRRLENLYATPLFTKKILDQTVHQEGKIITKKKQLSMRVLVAVCILALAGTAFATGLPQYVFKKMGEIFSDEQAKYEVIEEFSDKSATNVPLDDDGANFTLLQSYYDGAQLIVAYSLNVSAKADLTFNTTSDQYGALMQTEAIDTYTAQQALKADLSEAEYAQFSERLAKEGVAGVAYTRIVVGDGVTLSDGTAVMPYESYNQGLWTYVEYESPLPESARNKDSIALTFNVITFRCYYYMASDSAYMMSQRQIDKKVTVTVSRTADGTRSIIGAHNTEIYKANVQATLTPFNVRVSVDLNVPDEWCVIWDSIDELKQKQLDIIYQYMLVIGNETYSGMTMNEAKDGILSMKFDFSAPFILGQTELRLRPVYTISGPVSSEDIVIPIPVT